MFLEMVVLLVIFFVFGMIRTTSVGTRDTLWVHTGGLCLDRNLVLCTPVVILTVLLSVIIHNLEATFEPIIILVLLTASIAGFPIMRAASAKGKYRGSMVTAVVVFILIIVIALLSTTSVVLVVFFFESVVFLTVLLLIITGKSERVSESIQDMLTWAFGGSVLLIQSVVLINVLTPYYMLTNKALGDFVGAGLFLGFAVKVPVWPCTSWLLKVHVEASSEFSIYLSGFLVKVGVIAMWRTLVEFNLGTGVLWLVRSFAVVGLVEAVFRLYSQVDLKRFVAMTTIIETNWLTVCLYSGDNLIVGVGFILILVHAITTSMEFYVVELIYRRYSSRLVFAVSGVSAAYPNLGVTAWLVVLTTLGLPGSSIFALKLLFLIGVCKLNVALCLLYVFIFFLVMPVAIIRVWLPVLGGVSSLRGRLLPDISNYSICFLLTLVLVSTVIGLSPQVIL